MVGTSDATSIHMFIMLLDVRSSKLSTLQKEGKEWLLKTDFLFQETFEKGSLSSSSSGAASLKSELSESADLPPDGFQAPCGKEEDKACDEILSDDNFNLENIEKGIPSERLAERMRSGPFLLQGSFAYFFFVNVQIYIQSWMTSWTFRITPAAPVQAL